MAEVVRLCEQPGKMVSGVAQEARADAQRSVDLGSSGHGG